VACLTLNSYYTETILLLGEKALIIFCCRVTNCMHQKNYIPLLLLVLQLMMMMMVIIVIIII